MQMRDLDAQQVAAMLLMKIVEMQFALDGDDVHDHGATGFEGLPGGFEDAGNAKPAADEDGIGRWVTRQRSAATGTWSTTDLFSLAPNQTTFGKSIAADPAGNLFAAGYGYDAASVYHGWLVRRKLAP